MIFLQRFYRYHEMITKKDANKKKLNGIVRGPSSRPPYGKILLQCWPQCLNIFLVFFVTLSLFPGVQVNIKKSDPNFFISDKLYSKIMCFMTFNITAMVGSSIASLVQWVSSTKTVLFRRYTY